MKRIFLIPVFVCVTARLWAADADSSVATNALSTNAVTLEALVADILQHNPELTFYRAEIAAAKGESRTAASWGNPEFSVQAGQKRVTGGSLADEGLAWSVSLQQPFEWPGRIPLRKAIANKQVKLAELGLEQFKGALVSRARTLAYTVFAAQQKAAAAQEVADRFQQLREVLVQRDPAGLTPVLETRIIEATEVTAHHKASEQLLAAQSASLELNQIRGRMWTSSVQLAPADLVFHSAPDIDLLLAATRTNNFELQLRQAELEQQGLRVSLARKEVYPTFSVGPYYSEEKANERERIVGVGVSLPLPLWNRAQGSVETTRARQQQAETSLLVTQREIERRVVGKALTYQAKLREMSKWLPESVEEFRKAAELADRHYRLGAVPVATYVELQEKYLDAISALLDTKREALEAGQELQLLTGVDFNAVKVKEAK